MKKLLLLLLLLINLSLIVPEKPKILSTSTEKTYCDGWEKGYIQGYCYEVIGCVKPIVPICPIPKVGQTSYDDGYNRGFLKGKKDNNR